MNLVYVWPEFRIHVKKLYDCYWSLTCSLFTLHHSQLIRTNHQFHWYSKKVEFNRWMRFYSHVWHGETLISSYCWKVHISMHEDCQTFISHFTIIQMNHHSLTHKQAAPYSIHREKKLEKILSIYSAFSIVLQLFTPFILNAVNSNHNKLHWKDFERIDVS